MDELLWNLRIADVLDILVLSLVIYLLWRWFERRATRAVAIAVVGIGALYVASKALSMYMTVAVFQAGLTVILFAMVVIFQDDLRHAMERISAWRPFSRSSSVPTTQKFLDAVVETVTLLANERIGALIILPGRESLDRHLRGGIPVDGVASIELLHSIFDPSSRGHDGGVVLRNDRIDQLGVHLPLSMNLAEVGTRGTRHTAALGLAERTDALVIVVSEERGTISLAQSGKLRETESAASLERHLSDFLEKVSSRSRRPLTSAEQISTFAAQAGSLALATVLWFLFAFHIETVQQTFNDVPVEFRIIGNEWKIEHASPNVVRLTLVGPERAFAVWDPKSLKAAIEIRNASDGQLMIPMREEHLNLPEGIHLQESQPETIWLQLQRRAVQVEVRRPPLPATPKVPSASD